MGRWENNTDEIACSDTGVCAHTTSTCWGQGHSPLLHPSSSPPKQAHPQSLKLPEQRRPEYQEKLPACGVFVGSAYFFLRLFLPINRTMFGIDFASTHPDQSFCFPQYHFMFSLPVFISPQSPCIVLLSSLASMIPHCLVSPADFNRVPSLPVSEPYERRLQRGRG